ncbi:MAG: hypothetical protein IJV16_08400, partial [Lachnospiraceae bacterium]|nr:hypothetical protein [Lachnospiraceae bacterium]
YPESSDSHIKININRRVVIMIKRTKIAMCVAIFTALCSMITGCSESASSVSGNGIMDRRQK